MKKRYDFTTTVYCEMLNGATAWGLQLLDGDSDNVDELGVVVRVSGYSCPGDSVTPPHAHQDIEVLDVELGWEGEFTKGDLTKAEFKRIAGLIEEDLASGYYTDAQPEPVKVKIRRRHD